MTSQVSPTHPVEGRLYSLDFFRGLTMFLLIAEFTSLFEQLTSEGIAGSLVYQIGTQFHHHPWDGLRFWDLIQPFFMFIVGVAIPFSIANRRKKGQGESEIRKHVFRRAFLLLLFGWGLYCMGPGKIVFKFQNVLAQLSVTYLLAYLVMNRSFTFQLVFSLVLILITEVIYRTFPVEGFNHPFVKLENFGTWLDMQYGGADMYGGWVSFNAIPTTAHTIWGVLAGKLLMSERPKMEKLKLILIAAFTTLAIGYGISAFTPIIKRICTSSFVIVSGGWTLLALAFSFWLIDIQGWKKGVWIFAIVGMNPLFIYLFAHVGGANLLRDIITPFPTSLLAWTGELGVEIIISLLVLFWLWYLCYWLYKKKIFIRI